MWPKVLQQLFELLPHITRMVPLADRYLASRSNSDAALNTMARDVRSDIGRVAKAHMDLAGRLDDFAAHVDTIASETRQARTAVQGAELRLAALEQRVATQRLLLGANLIASLVGIILLAVLLIRGH